MIVIGSYILYYRFGEDKLLSPFQRMLKAKSSRYMLYVVVLFSIGGNIDKIGVLNSSPLVWSLAINFLVAVMLGGVVLVKVPLAGQQIRANGPVLFLLGCAMAIMMIVQMNAIVLTKVPYLIAIKRTSIVLSSLWGVWFLKEQGGLQRILAAVIMLIGVFVISFAQ
jgi:drug/metabolite transporter (DMT)-like permease